MKESFLHYVWQTRQFNFSNLKTTEGEPLELIQTGFPHQDGGPDFSNAKIRIDQALWVGHVEIHVQSSNWYDHRHNLDEAYDNTVLHVVYEHDRDVTRTDGTVIPCLELKNLISPNLYSRYLDLVTTSEQLPCNAFIHAVEPETKSLCVETMAIDRLQAMTEPILQRLKQSQNNWDQVFYQEVCAALGLRINKQPFAQLAKALPFTLLARHKNRLEQLEALLFGMAGFLRSESADPYESMLSKEFNFLRKKYSLTPIDRHLWKFLRLRPANFPTIRLAQLAQLLHSKSFDFSTIRENLNIEFIRALFHVSVSEYWKERYRFGPSGKPSPKTMGNTAIDLIIINAIVPTLFCYAHQTQNPLLRDRIFPLLEAIPPETNRIVTRYKSYGFVAKNALNTQGILQLNHKFCTFKLCLQCPIGHTVLKM